MKVLVLGASGGSGQAAVEQLLTRGHNVTVFARQVDASAAARERLHRVQGDALDARAVEQAVLGQDAVVVTLGIRENPLRVRLFGPARTRLDVRSAGTHNVITAMRKHGVRRLVVQTTYGVGATRDKLDFVTRLFFSLILKPQISDTELQNAAVVSSDLDWVLVQPVHLTDADDDTAAFASTVGETGAMRISRRSVGRFLADAVGSATFLRQTVSLSGARAAA
jgi:putative NADH-flavin reductase